jgi:hypothetical protein
MVDVLALVLLHDEQMVLRAVEQALNTGSPSKNSVMNGLSRLIEGAPIPAIEVAKPLVLTLEPQANVARYNRLLTAKTGAYHVDA